MSSYKSITCIRPNYKTDVNAFFMLTSNKSDVLRSTVILHRLTS